MSILQSIVILSTFLLSIVTYLPSQEAIAAFCTTSSPLCQTKQPSKKELIIDRMPPVIYLNQNIILKETDDVLASILTYIDEDSSYTVNYTSKPIRNNSKKICVIAIDSFNNASQACHNYVFVSDNPYVSYYKATLEETIQEYLYQNNIASEQIALSFYDIQTQETININAEVPFIAASSIKFPLGVVVYDFIQRGEISKQETMIYQKHHNVGGTTRLPFLYQYGDEIPIQSLLKYMLVYSDNNATQMLFERIALYGSWQTTMTSLFGVESDSIKIIGNVVNASYMMNAIQFVLHHEEQNKDFMEHLMAAYPNRYLKKYINEIPMLHKCGFYDANINDMGIVFGDNPYAIVIMTRQLSYAENHIGHLNGLIHSYLAVKSQRLEITTNADIIMTIPEISSPSMFSTSSYFQS